ncbi:MAG: septum formation initiator family protein [Clostridiales bacterium]|nr:septum formation initiator family protein [Clostridiales bacterium]
MTVGAGLGCGFIYDGFRLFRYYMPHPAFFIHLEDLLYWLLVTTAVFYIFLNADFEEMRFFYIMGTLAGMGLYFALLSDMVLTVAKAMLTMLARLAHGMYVLLSWPFAALYLLLSKPVIALAGKVKTRLIKMRDKMSENIKRVLQNLRNYVKMRIGTASKAIKTKARRLKPMKTDKTAARPAAPSVTKAKKPGGTVKSIKSFLVIVVCVVLAGGFSLFMKYQNDAYISVGKQLDAASKEIEAQRAATANLELELAKQGSDEYYEHIAREVLGLVYKNDIILKKR